MKHDFFYFFMIVMMWAACLLNLFLCFRSLRDLRWNRQIREVLWSYERELLERGVTLPPRCAWCCQILPKHVEGCALGFEWYKTLGKFREMTSRPPIKYFPKGEKPPDLGGNRG